MTWLRIASAVAVGTVAGHALYYFAVLGWLP